MTSPADRSEDAAATQPPPAGSPLAQVIESFERTMTRVDGLLYGYPTGQPERVRVGRESPHDDLLRAVLVLIARAFTHAVIQLIAVSAPAAAAAGHPGSRLLEWVSADPNRILSIVVSENAPADLTELCEQELLSTAVDNLVDVAGLLHDVLRCPSPWPNYRSTGPDSAYLRQLDELLARARNITFEADVISAGQSRPLDSKLVRDAYQLSRKTIHQIAETLLNTHPALSEPVLRPAPTAAAPPIALTRAVRTWARQQGFTVNTTGRLPRELIARYLASQTDPKD